MSNLVLVLAVFAAAASVVVKQSLSVATIRLKNGLLDSQRQALWGHLADLEKRRVDLEQRLKTAQAELSATEEQSAAASVSPEQVILPDPVRQGGWPAGAAYFYLPKSDINSVGFRLFDADHFSDEAAALFGMNPAEREAVDGAYNRLWQSFRALEIQRLEPVDPPEMWKNMVKSINYRIPALDRESTALKADFESGVLQALGPTRSPLLLEAVNSFLASQMDDLGQHGHFIRLLGATQRQNAAHVWGSG